jgi:hypothetical protein
MHGDIGIRFVSELRHGVMSDQHFNPHWIYGQPIDLKSLSVCRPDCMYFHPTAAQVELVAEYFAMRRRDLRRRGQRVRCAGHLHFGLRLRRAASVRIIKASGHACGVALAPTQVPAHAHAPAFATLGRYYLSPVEKRSIKPLDRRRPYASRRDLATRIRACAHARLDV